MKSILEDYVKLILYAFFALLLFQSGKMIFELHQDLFHFETIEFKAERLLSKEDIPIIYATHQYVLLNERFDPLEDVYALDQHDGMLNNLSVEGKVDTSRSGMYKLKYSVTNSLGLHNDKEIFVWVENYENDD